MLHEKAFKGARKQNRGSIGNTPQLIYKENKINAYTSTRS